MNVNAHAVTSERPTVPPEAAPIQGIKEVSPPAANGRGVEARFGELEAYRGIASLLIVIFHTYQYSREALGRSAYVYEGTPAHLFFSSLAASTAWFFVLSGFLVFLPFARSAIEQRNPQSARGFLIRRAIRIVPAYYIAFLIVWTQRFAGIPSQWTDLLQHLTFTHVFDSRYFFWTIGPSWSLAIEILFYVFLAGFGPLMQWLLARVPTMERRAVLLTLVVGLLTLGSLVYKWWAFYIAQIPSDNWPVYFGLIARFDALGMGMLLAIATAVLRGRPQFGRFGSALLLMLGLALMVVTGIFHEEPLVNLYFYALNGVAFLLVLASTVIGQRDSSWERTLSFRPLQFLGLFSYGVYLWHEPILIELGKRNLLINPDPSAFPQNAVVLVLAAIIAGALSYYLIERPAMELRHLFTREGRLAKRYPYEQKG